MVVAVGEVMVMVVTFLDKVVDLVVVAREVLTESLYLEVQVIHQWQVQVKEILVELDSMQVVIIFLVEAVVVLGLMEQIPYKCILVDKLLEQVVLV